MGWEEAIGRALSGLFIGLGPAYGGHSVAKGLERGGCSVAKGLERAGLLVGLGLGGIGGGMATAGIAMAIAIARAKSPAPAATALQRGHRCEHCFRHAPHTHLFPQIGPAQALILHISFLVHRSWKEICAEAHEAEAAGAEVPVTE
jgi:hypothetical protein